VLTPINEGDAVKVGDKIKVRIELRVDRDMEYVHMKDMRASCLEPVNVLSSYKWQGGLGYYETPKDASTNFFFDYLRKGLMSLSMLYSLHIRQFQQWHHQHSVYVCTGVQQPFRRDQDKCRIKKMLNAQLSILNFQLLLFINDR
jgi:hypothetical protein